MGIEIIQWEYNLTHDGNSKYTYGNTTQPMMGYNGNMLVTTQPMMGMEGIQWKFN